MATPNSARNRVLVISVTSPGTFVAASDSHYSARSTRVRSMSGARSRLLFVVRYTVRVERPLPRLRVWRRRPCGVARQRPPVEHALFPSATFRVPVGIGRRSCESPGCGLVFGDSRRTRGLILRLRERTCRTRRSLSVRGFRVCRSGGEVVL